MVGACSLIPKIGQRKERYEKDKTGGKGNLSRG
jgi:hypothetical protein